MNDHVRVMAIVEGRTEVIFVKRVLAPYLGRKNVYIYPTQASNKGQRGGDIRFRRIKNDLEKALRQDTGIYVTTMVDYYGLKEWCGLEQIKDGFTTKQVAETLNDHAKREVINSVDANMVESRYIPFMVMHEFEALLFSDFGILSEELGCNQADITRIVDRSVPPEEINNNKETAPSKRLDKICDGGRFAKTSTGINIAEKIGIDRMRKQCPLFNEWITTLESLPALQPELAH